MEKQKEKQLQSRECKGRRSVHLTSTESNDAAWNKKLLNATLCEKSFKFCNVEKITFTNELTCGNSFNEVNFTKQILSVQELLSIFEGGKNPEYETKCLCANEHELVVSSVMSRDTYKSLTGRKDMWKGRLKSTGAIRQKGNVKTNDRDTGGQISPGAEAAGSEVTGEVLGGWVGID